MTITEANLRASERLFSKKQTVYDNGKNKDEKYTQST